MGGPVVHLEIIRSRKYSGTAWPDSKKSNLVGEIPNRR